MRYSYKSTLIVIGVVILILINFACFWIGYRSFLNPKLSEFSIEEVVEVGENLVLNVTESHHATEYVVEIWKDGKKQYTYQSETTSISLTDFRGEYNDTFEIKAIAKNKNGIEKESTNTLTYTYKDATILKEKDHLLSGTRDLNLYILGFDYNESYEIELYYGKEKLYETEITSVDVSIPYEVVEGYSGRITAYLRNASHRITSTFNFYLNTPIVGKVNITSPVNGYSTRWNDINLEYTGGTNANHFYITLTSSDGLYDRFEVYPEENKIIVPAAIFQEEKNYTLTLEAMYEDYVEIAETSSIDVYISKKETTNGVYVSHNPTFIKQGTVITLNTTTNDATIYYTIDGSDPTPSSNVYTVPIVINENITIKTIAVSKNRYDSSINTYNFQINEKTPVIFLSPSNQNENYGVSSVGYTTEMAIMNRVADVVESKLKEAGFIVYRNNPATDINAWTATSNYVHADFHFAIHSNASSHHTARGIEIYVDNETSLAFSIASNIYENLWSIYDGNDNYSYHRGVKFARGSLGEANDLFVPCGSLIEIAYHDEYNDAFWVMNNIEAIGENLANSIISYYN